MDVVTYIKDTKTSQSTAVLASVARTGSFVTVKYLLAKCPRNDVKIIAQNGCVDNAHRAVRQLCLSLVKPASIPVMRLRALFHHEDHTMEEIKHAVSVASARASKTSESLAESLDANGILDFAIYRMVQDD